ncbi:MAG: CAP domain-containing protein [Spirochaetales bacterium]|nr:CAP domain-containing protein [Spirochaetales bacterium]
MINKIIACFFFLVFTVTLCHVFADENSAWSPEMYEEYDYKTFAELDAANTRIDMANIDYPLLHAAVFYETNRQRVLNKLSMMKHSPALEKSAKGHSDDMASRNFFSHTSKVKGKETLKKRLALVGVENCTCGENIANSFGIEYQAGKGIYTPEQNGGYFSYKYKGDPIENHTYLGLAKSVLKQWMKSPGHKKNILNPKYTFLGTGAAHYLNKQFFGMDYFYFTQNFADIKGPDVEE